METFLNYKKYRWLWVNLATLVVLIGIYVVNSPVGGRNGGTVVGYTYGTLGALAIVVLALLGVRKRSYKSNVSTVEGWVAVHIWLGLSLIVLVPLHAGFSFGINIHTLAYALMMLVILSGVWGAYNYLILPKELLAHRGGTKPKESLETIQALTNDIGKILDNKSDLFKKAVTELDVKWDPRFKSLFGLGVSELDKGKAQKLISELEDVEHDAALDVLQVIELKRNIIQGLLRETKARTLLKLWLYIHVPLTLALLVALAIHILVVLLYR